MADALLIMTDMSRGGVKGRQARARALARLLFFFVEVKQKYSNLFAFFKDIYRGESIGTKHVYIY